MSTPRRPRVLVVDDEPLVLRALARVLQRLGIDPDKAANGDEALGLMAQHPYDLVVSDLRMPVLDGVGLLRAALRGGHRRGAFVFLTGHGDGVASDLLALGADAVYAKPLGGSDVEALVWRWTGAPR
jgi:CheY-like chemotaxis protein